MAERIDKADFERLTALAMSDPGRDICGRNTERASTLRYSLRSGCRRPAGQAHLSGRHIIAPVPWLPPFQRGSRFCSGGKDFTRQQLEPIKNCIEHYIGQRYGLEVSVREPRELKHEREYANLKIDKWQVAVVTSPERKDVPRQRIKLEVANIDAGSREPRALQLNYSFLPDGYRDTLVLTETFKRDHGRQAGVAWSIPTVMFVTAISGICAG